MDYARLEITFKREYAVISTVENYFITTTILPTVTTPAALETCLLIVPGTAMQDEILARVATKAELTTYPLPLPGVVNQFYAADLAGVPGGIQVGDVIKIRTPILPIWSQLDGVVDGTNYTVNNVVSPTLVEVTPVFSSFGRDLYFQVWRTGVLIHPPVPSDPYLTGGIANRDYTGAPPAVYYQADTHKDWYGSDLDAAMSAYAALEAGAQGIVNEYNTDEFTGSGTEVFE